nr:hypothetical protein Iba_chr08bCG12610 [Ipomoea batatas]GMD27469.1 hypothetical protein Iba_chr08dCG14060 [Ipomoea batatas]
MLSLLSQLGKITLLLMDELLFSFANASFFALFLQRVVNRFFTALSVLRQTTFAISVHLLPNILCACRKSISSSGDHPPLLKSEFK